MAKTIRFNLICDEKPVRTIEDLQNNFSIEDVLAYYNNQLLHRWLRVRGYDTELEAVSAITSTEPMDIIKELIHIFDVVADEKKVEESIYMLKYLDERKELYAIYYQEKFNTNHIIEDYEAGYRQLVFGIIEHPNDAAVIKANIAEIASNYSWVLQLNHRELFWTLKECSVLAVMCLLMNDKSRHYYLPVEVIDEYGDSTPDIDLDKYKDKQEMFDEICSLIKTSFFMDALGENLHTFAGVTDGYWKDLEPKGKRFMIISIESGDYVRSAGKSGEELALTDIRDQFVIIDGIDYKSNTNTHRLLYMEV